MYSLGVQRGLDPAQNERRSARAVISYQYV